MKKNLIFLMFISITTFGQSVSILPDNTIGSNINTPLILKTNGINRLHITNEGLVGIGLVSPQNILQIHQSSNSNKSVLKFTNTNTGSAISDGLELGYAPNSNIARLFNFENAGMSLGTNNIESINIANSGEVLITNRLAIGETLGNAYKLAVVGDTYLQGDTHVGSLIGTGTRPVHTTNEGKLIRGSLPVSTNMYHKFLNVSAANTRIVGITSSTNFTYMATACLAYLSTGVKYGNAKLVLPVEFPDGANISLMTLNAIDNVTFLI